MNESCFVGWVVHDYDYDDDGDADDDKELMVVRIPPSPDIPGGQEI